jgi:hypothetical protein
MAIEKAETPAKRLRLSGALQLSALATAQTSQQR